MIDDPNIQIVDSDHQWTRWRDLAHPMEPSDLLQKDALRFEDGKLPLLVVLLGTDKMGERVHGPVRFLTEGHAANWVEYNAITRFIVIPLPT